MFKDLFVQLLEEHNITAYKLSKDTGITESLISQWKNGRQLPKYENIRMLCDYFNINADYLLGRSGKMYNNSDGLNENNLQIMAKRIKNLCEKKGLSINKMLTESNAGARTYHNIMAGSYPSTDKISKIADYFNCSVDYLLGRTENPAINTAEYSQKEGLTMNYHKYTIRELLEKYTTKELLTIKANMRIMINNYGAEKFCQELGIEFKDFKEFAIPEVPYGYKLIEKLDKALEILNTDIDTLLGRNTAVSYAIETAASDPNSYKNPNVDIETTD